MFRQLASLAVFSQDRRQSPLLFLFDCVFLVRFDRHIYRRTLLESDLFALFILEGVGDTNLTIELLTPFNVDLCLLRFARVNWLDDFLNSSR